MFSVKFSGSLLELKAMLAEMPDNLAGVLHCSFEAVSKPSILQVEEDAWRAALPFLRNGQKIAAIKAVRTVAQLAGNEDLGTLRGAKDFVEDYELAREKTAGQPYGGK